MQMEATAVVKSIEGWYYTCAEVDRMSAYAPVKSTSRLVGELTSDPIVLDEES